MKQILATVVGVVIGLIVVMFFVGLLFTFPVMWLWNWLMPDIFGLPELSFWQTWGLLILSSFLFKNNYSTFNSKS